ncbi:spore coat protein U domain-containing protein [Citrobacter meridianamericanus]|uniref:Spore coat protein U domain-containing protein n=1 Tax=Citrobacter meridianamericanus TaxID=2894201 RepID=A0ABT1B1U3_9ENTR|nr:spore coat protein U domain-containing protein [Citrobacter meridianamericanus]MCO5779775.1 spore coat protein U domain-containing protein [Citrobacter meridianamericanus]
MRLRHLLLIATVLFCPAISHAVTCSVSNVQPINLGSVNPLSATGATSSMTFNYTCAKELGDALAGINLCFNIGASAVSGQVTPRNMSLNGTPAQTLAYQLYQDPGHTKVWGSQYQSGTTFPMVQLNLLNLTPVTGSLTVSAQIVTPQTSAVPGNYQDTYTTATAFVTLNPGLLLPPTTCGDTVAARLPFTVSATVSKQCNITSATDISFAPARATGRNLTASNTVGVACSNNTPYTIGLQPSNGNTTGNGVMTGTGSNTDKVPYQLSSTPGPSGTVWGNTSLNTVTGNGTGTTTSYPVYATVPSANYTPDSYADTVTIAVTY